MTEYRQPTIGNTNDNNTIIIIPPLQNNEPRQLKTNDYTLNAVKKYRLKNADKVKEYNQLYIKKKKDEKKKQNPYIDLNKKQLYEKIFELENKIKELELKK
jgi:hypothetical protein